MTVTVTIWWPRSDVRIYQIVTGVTSDVGVSSTHLVCLDIVLMQNRQQSITWTNDDPFHSCLFVPSGIRELKLNEKWGHKLNDMCRYFGCSAANGNMESRNQLLSHPGLGWLYVFSSQKFACLQDKVRTTHPITIKRYNVIAQIMVITWLNSGIALFEIVILAYFFFQFRCVSSRWNTILAISQEWLVRFMWN